MHLQIDQMNQVGFFFAWRSRISLLSRFLSSCFSVCLCSSLLSLLIGYRTVFMRPFHMFHYPFVDINFEHATFFYNSSVWNLCETKALSFMLTYKIFSSIEKPGSRQAFPRERIKEVLISLTLWHGFLQLLSRFI